jgi:aminopeptidase N
LNEGFATFGELLWNETKSEQEAEMTAYSDLSRYLEYASNSADPIVNFYYADKEDMFNSLTYRKGSRVLNLLRSEIGEEAFFLGIKKYLATYQFNSAEVHDFRKIMEEASGRDLNLFFNQWLYQGGYPGLELNYSKNDKKLTIHYQQKNSDSNFIYQYPLVIKFIHPTLKSIHSEKIFIHKKQDSITLKTEFDVMPIIITDYHHNCLAKITEMKSDGEKLRSLENTNSYYEAARILDQTDSSTDKIIFDKMIIHLLQSDNTALIKLGLNNIPEKNTSFMSQLYLLVDHKNAQIRRRALQELSFNPQEKNIPIALQRLNDPSWQVQAAAIQCLSKSNYKDLDQIVKQNYTSASIDIVRTISNILIAKNNMADSNFYQYHITRSAGFNRSLLMNHYMKIAIASKDINQIKNTWKQISFYAMQMENISDRINATRVLAQSWNSIEDKKDLTSEFEALKSRILIAEKIDDVKKVWNTDKKL